MARRRIRPLRDRSVESELKFRVSGPRAHAKLRAALKKRGAKLEARYDEENYRFGGPAKVTPNTTLRLHDPEEAAASIRQTIRLLLA